MIAFLKTITRGFLDEAVIPLLQYVALRIPGTTVLRELERNTAQECARYAESKMQTSLQFTRRKDLLDHALELAAKGGIIAEFGVWKGRSINHIAKRVRPSIIVGFDSFEGLGEDWSGWSLSKRAFDLGGKMPAVLENVRLVKGWFNNTLPGFLAENPSSFSFVHIDCDTYEAANTVLDLIGPRIQTGTVLVFDEYFGYRGWKIGEYRAWQEFVGRHVLEYEYLAFSDMSVSVRVTRK